MTAKLVSIRKFENLKDKMGFTLVFLQIKYNIFNELRQ